MENSRTEKRKLIGLSSYDNWQAYLGGAPILDRHEYELYSDAWMTGEVTDGLGPYQFFNLVNTVHPKKVRRVAVLSFTRHIEYETPLFSKTDHNRYHGGLPTDEIAALSSLLMGCRIYCGAATRYFNRDTAPEGRPQLLDEKLVPSLIFGERGPVLPSALGQHSLMALRNLALYPKVSSEGAIYLIKASRLYQDALWIGEAEPHLSWLMMVSAVETAANHWRGANDSPLDRMKVSKPALVELLVRTNIPDLPEMVAGLIADSLGSTKKFVDFLIAFLPPAPSKRPKPPHTRIKWTEDELRKSFRKIYSYRSKALHAGIPFPAPMCEPPFKHQDWPASVEKHIGVGSAVYGGRWMAEDIPMNLHMFEYIARNAIIKWWESLG